MRLLLIMLAGVAIISLTPASAQTLRIGLQEDPDTLDGAKNWSFVGRNVMTSICDKLVDIGPDASIVPMLATNWTTSADGKAITFKPAADADPSNAGALESPQIDTSGDIAGELSSTIGGKPVRVPINIR